MSESLHKNLPARSAPRSGGSAPVAGLCPLLLAAVMAIIGGCGGLTFEPAPAGEVAAVGAGESVSPEPPAESPELWRDESVWPRRLPVRTGLGSWARQNVNPSRPIMGTIVPVTGPLQAAGASKPAQERVERELYSDVQTLMQRRTGRSVWRNYTVVGEGPGSYLFVTSDDPFASDIWDGPAGKPAAYFKFISARPAATAGASGREVVFTDGLNPSENKAPRANTRPSADERRLLIERTWFALYSAKPGDGAVAGASSQPPKGLIVLLPGMFGTPQPIVQEFIGKLRAENYAVLRALAHPSRFTEQVTFGIVETADLRPQAELVAKTLTDRAAECAYAVQAAVLHSKDTNPELRGLPVTLLGLSGGAMVLPTVVARDPDAFKNAILIAGGADFLRVAIESNYKEMVDALHFVWFPSTPAKPEPLARPDGRTAPSTGMMRADAEPSAELLARFAGLYHDAAPLDNVSTASSLKQLRCLFVLATGDKAVPFARGEQLWQAAGKPDRYLTGGGHEMLFLFLPNSFSKIISWLESSERGRLSSLSVKRTQQDAGSGVADDSNSAAGNKSP